MVDNKALVRRSYEEIWSQGRLEQIAQLYHPDFVLVDPLTPGVHGPEGYC